MPALIDSAALKFFETLKEYADVEHLIAEGQTEGLYLECKSPSSPQLNKDLRAKLAKAISGFANTAGGVVIWGISTTKHQHGVLDVLTQLEPIANCSSFEKQVIQAAITATTPRIPAQCRVLRAKPADTKGVVVTFVPQTSGDPVRTNDDEQFYMRSGDKFTVAPYELIKRLFAATESPDLTVAFRRDLVTTEADGTWKVPIILENRSSAVAQMVIVSVVVENPLACDSITVKDYHDKSNINPGSKIFIKDKHEPIHRGMNFVDGYLTVKMKIKKKASRVLKIRISLYANQMRARSVTATVSLAKKGFSVTRVTEAFLY